MRLTDQQIERYSRQIILRELGGTGQTALLAARVVVAGSGAAFDTAVTYLAGAGVGALDVLPAAGAALGAVLPFPPMTARNPEVRSRRVDRPSALSLDDYDVFLVLSEEGGTAAAAPALPPGRPALGSVVLRAHVGQDLLLAVVPRSHGCAACIRFPVDVLDEGTKPRADVAALASAGALAALAACRWVLGLDADAGPRVLSLGDADAVWLEGALERLASCPRGCPPSAQPV